MDTRGRPGDRQPADPERWPATSTPGDRPVPGSDNPDLIDLSPVQRRRLLTGSTALIVSLVATLGSVAALSFVPRTEVPVSTLGPSGIGVASSATLPAPTATPTPTRTPRPTPSRAPRTPGPIITPNYPSWRWEPIPFAALESQDAHFLDVHSLPGLFVAVGYTSSGAEEPVTTPVVIASADGRTWSPVALPTPDFRPEASVVVDGTLMLMGYAVGDMFELTDATRRIWATTDGSQWTRIGRAEGLIDDHGSVRSMVAGPSGWVAVVFEVVEGQFGSESGRLGIKYSVDGRQWSGASEVDVPDESSIIDIATDGSRWIMLVEREVSGATEISTLRSDDGMTWTPGQVARLIGDGHDIAHGPGGFVIVGGELGPVDFEPRVWTSPDGEAWTQHTVGMFGDRTAVAMTEVISTERGYLAISDSNGEAWVSADGATWENFRVFDNASPGIESVAVRGDVVAAMAQGGFGQYFALVGDLAGMHR